jgi:uncharacterized protein YbjT (DUF2867 family)
LVTGATGYVGGRLVPLLHKAGFRVRCTVRSASKLRARPWASEPGVEIVEADAADTEAMAEAMQDCEAGYYLIHSMQASGSGYAEHDNRIAEAFAEAAAQANLNRIIYLGGLGELSEGLSEHLSSRREVERRLAAGSTPVTVLRAAMIIGSGSASFEILRYFVERLPIMITPRWVFTRCQPIAIADVLGYLRACLDQPQTTGRTLDIGGPDVVTYRELMDITADALGLERRWVIPVPLLTPRLSSLWIHLVTPVDARIARPLAEGLGNEVICRDETAFELMPGRRQNVREAIDQALRHHQNASVPTAWTDAGLMPGDPDWAGGTVYTDERRIEIKASPEVVFEAVCKAGGGHGWYGADWLWRLRGLLDRLVGGPGLRRGRRDPRRLAYGDALDFWRVTAIERPRLLRLRGQMKLPGEAELDFRIEPHGGDNASSCTLTQTARFQPHGLAGILYWYAVAPLHHMVFSGMIHGIRRTAIAGPGR